MAYKKIKKTKKKEDLPSFLTKTPENPEKFVFSKKTSKPAGHLGPIFLGCHEYQPILHSLDLGRGRELHKTASSTENILRDAFLPKTSAEKRCEEKTTVYSQGKTKTLYPDPYPHKCPGLRRIYAPDSPFAINIGATTSTVEGEASREIPVLWVRKTLDGVTEGNCSLIELSDIWEKKRKFMSHEERMAHPHFPKRFVTLLVMGPTIPASITVSKLPSKRRTDSELDLEIQPQTKTKITAKQNDLKSEKVTQGNKGASKENFSTKDASVNDSTIEMIEEESGDEKNDETNEESDQEEPQSELDATYSVEEIDAKENDDVKIENEALDEEGFAE